MTNTQQGRATFREPTVTFPAVRGVQAGREYYTTMCPLSLVPRLFFFDEEEVRPELRAQRSLNRARVPEIARYILHNPDSYTFSALTASIDGDAQFVPIDGDANYNVGHLTMALGTPLLINDGQHRRKAIEEALAHRPELGSESIPVVFFLDAGLERSQQMFADLNTHAVRPSQSIGILYNHRDPVARLAKELARLAPVFAGRIEMEKTSISNRSTKLFTLSAVYQATSALLRKAEGETVGADERQLAIAYWTRLGEVLPEWRNVAGGQIAAAEVRADYIHGHGVALQALGRAGAALLRVHRYDWRDHITRLQDIDWRRANGTLWEGRALHLGRVNKAQQSVLLTTAVIKRALDLPLTAEESRAEAVLGERGPLAMSAEIDLDHEGEYDDEEAPARS